MKNVMKKETPTFIITENSAQNFFDYTSERCGLFPNTRWKRQSVIWKRLLTMVEEVMFGIFYIINVIFHAAIVCLLSFSETMVWTCYELGSEHLAAVDGWTSFDLSLASGCWTVVCEWKTVGTETCFVWCFCLNTQWHSCWQHHRGRWKRTFWCMLCLAFLGFVLDSKASEENWTAKTLNSRNYFQTLKIWNTKNWRLLEVKQTSVVGTNRNCFIDSYHSSYQHLLQRV